MGETPRDWGFDEYLTDNTAGGWYWETKYNKNGETLNLPEGTYGPDVIQEFTFDFHPPAQGPAVLLLLRDAPGP